MNEVMVLLCAMTLTGVIAEEPKRAGAAPAAQPAGNLTDDLVADPQVQVEEIVYCVRTPRIGVVHAYEQFGYTSGFDANRKRKPGEGFQISTGGKLVRLNLRNGESKVILEDQKGAIRDAVVHYDAKKILFSYRKGDRDTYSLFEIDIDGAHLRQITDSGDKYDDIEPCYLPDGGIAFTSARCNWWVPCFVTQVAVMHRCDSDGKNIKRLSANPEHELTPCVLPDGRILFTRWDYTDMGLSGNGNWALWSIYPDGSHLAYVYGLTRVAMGFINAHPVPGTDLLAAIESEKNAAERQGKPALFNMSHDPDLKRNYEILNVESLKLADGRSCGNCRDIYPLSRRWFLIVCEDRIGLLDRDRNIGQIIVDLKTGNQRGAVWPHEPVPLIARPREPVLSAVTNWQKTNGRILINDIHYGQPANHAGLQRGEIAGLAIYEPLPLPIHLNGNQDTSYMGWTYNLKRYIGTVPVESDGSVYAEVPGRRALQFVAVDKDGNELIRMANHISVMPGETLSCVGCHEYRKDAGPLVGAPLLASRKSAVIPDRSGLPEVMDFPRDIQPILDKHCVSCHGGEKWEGKLSLAGDRGLKYSHSYLWLTALGQCKSSPGDRIPLYRPKEWGIAASPILPKLRGAHHKVTLSDNEYRMVQSWCERMSPWAGTVAAMVASETTVTWPKDVFAQRCLTCHVSDSRKPVKPGPLFVPPSRAAVIAKNTSKTQWGYYGQTFMATNLYTNITRPERSMLLLAPLSKDAGGLGWCMGKDGKPAKVFADKNDAGYEALLKSIIEAKTVQTLYDSPTFRPRREYLREMIRYGVLPPDAAADNKPYSGFALDEAYWQATHQRDR